MRSRDRFFDPLLTGFRGIYYWPPGIPRNDGVDTWAQLFRLHGYQECDSAEPEGGFEKIAIYGDSEGTAQHVARQLPSGAWTSKLGHGEDISHMTLGALIGETYGTISKVMHRKLPQADTLAE